MHKVRSAKDLGILGDGIHDCVKSAFGRPDFSREDTTRHISSDRLIVAMNGDRVVGFSSLVFGSPNEILADNYLPDIKGSYLAAAAVVEEAKGKGIYQHMNDQRIAVALGRRDEVLFTRTQNPLVETSITRTLERNAEEGEIAGYSLQRVLIPGCYGSQLTAETPPPSPDPKIQKAHDRLDLTAGDAYVLLYAIGYKNGGTAFLDGRRAQ